MRDRYLVEIMYILHMLCIKNIKSIAKCNFNWKLKSSWSLFWEEVKVVKYLLFRSVLVPVLCARRVSESDGLLLIRKDSLGDHTSCGKA